MSILRFGRGRDGRDPLLSRAAGLPQDLQPARDLWPGIRARLAEQPRVRPAAVPKAGRGWPAALAAGALIAAVSALLTWGLLRDGEPMAPAGLPDAAVYAVNYGPNTGLSETQLRSRDELLAQFSVRLAELSPATRETVLKNLAVIQQAADEIDAALAEDPASALLNGLLVHTLQQELQLYSRVVASGAAPSRRT